MKSATRINVERFGMRRRGSSCARSRPALRGRCDIGTVGSGSTPRKPFARLDPLDWNGKLVLAMLRRVLARLGRLGHMLDLARPTGPASGSHDRGFRRALHRVGHHHRHHGVEPMEGCGQLSVLSVSMPMPLPRRARRRSGGSRRPSRRRRPGSRRRGRLSCTDRWSQGRGSRRR
jgi:hypothetical protein